VFRGLGSGGKEDGVERISFNREKGQALILVTLMVVVLFGFLALALDMGNVYAGRRRMQNAADAGALAGARELCFGSGSRAQARVVAEDYAINHNGAQAAVADIPSDGYTVTVVATQRLDTFFARVIGIQTADVSAEAAALCGRAIRGGALWPLAFSYDVYSDSLGCGEQFMVFTADDVVLCAGDCDCVSSPGITQTSELCHDLCDCNIVGPHIGAGNRGWLRLFEPDEGFPDDDCENQGALSVACWLRYGHPGIVWVGDCLEEKTGVTWSNPAREAITYREDDIVNIVLWERLCDQPGDPEPRGGYSSADNKAYLVAGFGCVQVVGWEIVDIPKCGNTGQACQTGKNLKVIHVTKICEHTHPEDYLEY
jgi:Flp pilus assembly protein TadG